MFGRKVARPRACAGATSPPAIDSLAEAVPFRRALAPSPNNALTVLPRSQRKAGVRLDLIGAFLLLVSLLCILGPILDGADLGWSYWLALPLAFGAGMLGIFWRSQAWVENRGGLPLIHQTLIRDRHFATGLGAVFLLGFANLSFYLPITFYLQNELHFTPLRSGATIVPLAIVFAIVTRRAGPRAQKLGVQALIEGCCVAIAALGALIALTASIAEPPAVVLAITLMLFGAGQAMVKMSCTLYSRAR